MNNITIGNKTEKTVSSMLREKGYWVYNCPRNSSGAQPIDLIGIKGGKTIVCWFIDGKHVREQNPSFPLSRIEPNQLASMKYLNEFAKINITNLGFAIQFERTREIYWLCYDKVLDMIKNDEKSINLNKLKLFEEVLNENDNK